MIYHDAPQGSPEWLEARRGVVTGSRYKDVRDRLAGKPEKIDKKTGEVIPAVRGLPSSKCVTYAMDVARERCGGRPADVYQNAAMRFGSEQEPLARMNYERRTNNLVEEVGFYTTPDRLFGVSVDGLIGTDGVWECKTMVASDTLWRAVVDGNISDYIDQVQGGLWLLHRKWCDLTLWTPDLAAAGLSSVTRRIERDDDYIDSLVSDLLEFKTLVDGYEQSLRRVIAEATASAAT